MLLNSLAAHDVAGNGALEKLQIAVNRRPHLLHALFGHLPHVGRKFEGRLVFHHDDLLGTTGPVSDQPQRVRANGAMLAGGR
ncbi:MAG: hypothetical protein ACXW3S_02560 [Rhodoplanes sp.]